MAVLTGSTFRFAEYEVREPGLRVTRAGEPVAIEPKAHRVLVYLLQHPGRIVTKEELLSAVWGDTAVSDNSLTRAIALLRRLLDDHPHMPRFIETISTVGYRFICPVETSDELGQKHAEVAQQASASAESSQRGSTARPRWRNGALVAAVATVVVGTFVILAVWCMRDGLLSRIRMGHDSALPEVQSIAVLPFENLSGDPSQEFFADGLTDELITSLGSHSSLRVISRSSVMRFKGSQKPLPEIARELGVDGIIEGTVVHVGNRVRITANLLHGPSDKHLWADSYESQMEDVLVVQSRVARSVSGAIKSELSRQERTAAAPRRVNPEAYQAYLEGRYHTNRWNHYEFEKAESALRRSIDLDPTFAPAYSAMATLYTVLGIWGIRPATQVLPQAKAAAVKAVELDDDLAEAHGALGMVKLIYDWDWAGSEREHRRAVLLNPSSADAHTWYGVFLTGMGREEEALREFREAVRLDPVSPSPKTSVAWTLYWSRRHDEAILQLNKALELDQNFSWAYTELAWNYDEKRMYPEAITNCRRALDLNPDEQVILATCGRAYALAGRQKHALALLARLQILAQKDHVDPWYIAWLYDGMGDTEHSVEYLQRAYNERSSSLYIMKVALVSERLRSDPRYQELLHRLNFPASQ